MQQARHSWSVVHSYLFFLRRFIGCTLILLVEQKESYLVSKNLLQQLIKVLPWGPCLTWSNSGKVKQKLSSSSGSLEGVPVTFQWLRFSLGFVCAGRVFNSLYSPQRCNQPSLWCTSSAMPDLHLFSLISSCTASSPFDWNQIILHD